MGTRADFYTSKNETLTWIGSIAWDGYISGIPDDILNASSVENYINDVNTFIGIRNDGRFPKDGWPWPWNDSNLTDCVYCFFEDENLVKTEHNKYWLTIKDSVELNNIDDEEEYDNKFQLLTEGDKKISFPDMSEDKNVTDGGFLVFYK